MDSLLGASLALKAVHRDVNSARPDAPVRTAPPAHRSPAHAFRRRTARMLYRLADWVQPTPRRALG
ncbi:MULTISPECIES: hypothetical protein [Catenuloplanes]|uniref:Uncharacterized protein n=1 Tax=Catenuloplanes niger TaxID=587534 RepID=A0AAE4CR80_9ACTN|nr:hypothetical protein [Catenuloplanes niger]MDR7321267.1 hypothetical protein [Catenuloplanes niger]